jgi:hypothetical protein
MSKTEQKENLIFDSHVDFSFSKLQEFPDNCFCFEKCNVWQHNRKSVSQQYLLLFTFLPTPRPPLFLYTVSGLHSPSAHFNIGSATLQVVQEKLANISIVITTKKSGLHKKIVSVF